MSWKESDQVRSTASDFEKRLAFSFATVFYVESAGSRRREQRAIRTRLTREKLLREPDKPRGISHSDSLCIARGANVALFNSVIEVLSPWLDGRPLRGEPLRESRGARRPVKTPREGGDTHKIAGYFACNASGGERSRWKLLFVNRPFKFR